MAATSQWFESSGEAGHDLLLRGYIHSGARRLRCQACGMNVREVWLDGGEGRLAGWYSGGYSETCESVKAAGTHAANLSRPMGFEGMVEGIEMQTSAMTPSTGYNKPKGGKKSGKGKKGC